MQSYRVHLANKYPHATIHQSESSISVIGAGGELLCSVSRNGFGQWKCDKKRYGSKECFDLAPIPRDTRAVKLHKNGDVEPDDEFDHRRKKGLVYAKLLGHVPSEKYLKDLKEESDKGKRELSGLEKAVLSVEKENFKEEK